MRFPLLEKPTLHQKATPGDGNFVVLTAIKGENSVARDFLLFVSH
jgi:hypothetical protein